MAEHATAVLLESTAHLSAGGKTVTLPVIEGSEGERGIDITNTRAGSRSSIPETTSITARTSCT